MPRRAKQFLVRCTLGLIAAGMGAATAGTTGPPTLPDTPAGRLMRAMIASINSQSAPAIRTFVATAFDEHSSVNDSWPSPCCDPTHVTATLLNLAKRSGGLTLDEVNGNGTQIVAFVRARSRGTKIYLELQATKDRPWKIRDYQLLPMPHPTTEVLDKVPPTATMSERIEVAKRALRRSAEKDLFSGSVAIALRGKLLLTGAYGEADKTTHRKVTLETQFDIASVGKLFTGVAIAQLVAKGVLDYDTPIVRYLPDYPNREAAAKITLRQLLTHTSGLADIYSEGKPKTRLRRLTDYYPLFASKPLLFEPGKGQSYSNTGFLVASMVVERVTHEDFRTYLRSHIFQPAGMSHTGWLQPANAAVPYTLSSPDDPLAPHRPWTSAESFYAALLGGPAVGAGGEYSTAMDLVAFANALQSGRILDHQAFLQMVRQGLGCLCFARGRHLLFGHDGGGPGIDTGVQLDLGQHFVLAFVSNYSPPFPQQLAADLSQMLDQD